MGVYHKLAPLLVALFGLLISTQAIAQALKFHVSFAGNVDCDQPIPAKNIPISGDGAGVLNVDGSASADVTETAFFIFSTRIHFEGRLGSAPTTAPGGSAQIRVAGKHSLRLIWNLPTDQLVVHIDLNGQVCSAIFEAKLRPGQHQYTLFDGYTYHYCDIPRVQVASCQVQ